MKKFFSFVAAALVSLSMFATKVTFDFSSASAFGYDTPAAGEFTQLNSGDVLTKDGVTITVSFTSGNGVRFFANTNTGVINLREYVGSVLTISAPAGSKINAINIDGSNLTSTYLSGDVTSKDWTGDANSVTINIIKSTVQINSMVVTLDETPGPTTVDTITVSQAKARIDADNLGKCYVYGRVVTVDDSKIAQYHNLNCWFVDLANPLDTLEGYKMNGANNAAYNSADEVEYIAGDTVLFYASALKKYGTTYEINEGYYAKTLGAAPRAEQKDVTINSVTAAVDGEGDFNFTIAVAVDGTPYTMEFDKEPISKDAESLAGVYSLEGEEMGSVTFAAGSTLTIAFVSTGVYSVSINAVDGEGLKYVGKNESVNIAGNFPKDNTSVDVLAAVEVAIATGTTATTSTYTIYGYVAKIKDAYSDQYKNISFYMSDNATATSGEFVAYRAKVADGAQVPVVGDCVKVTGAIVNYQGNTPETNGTTTCEIIDPATIPADIRHGKTPQTIDATVTEALTVGNALEQNASTFDMYHVIGYVTIAYEVDEKGEQTFYIAEAPIAGETATDAEKDNSILIQYSVPDSPVAVGDQMDVVGKITHYYRAASEGKEEKEYICIRNGVVKHVATAIPEVIMNDSFNKAQKVVVDGKIVIIRNGVQYNAAGARL